MVTINEITLDGKMRELEIRKSESLLVNKSFYLLIQNFIGLYSFNIYTLLTSSNADNIFIEHCN